MDTAHDTRLPGGGPRPPLGGLTRSSDDTVISGLCGGLGRHFGIDPLVFRIAFVVMSLAGGTGLLLYLVGWALVPDDQGNTFGARWLPGEDRGHKLVAAALAGVGLLLLFDRLTDGHGDDVPLGLVLVGLGAAVLWSRRGGSTGSGPGPVPPGGSIDTAPTAPGAPPAEPSAAEPSAGEPGESTAPDPTADHDLTTPLSAGSSVVWQATPSVPPPVYAPRAVKPPKPPKPPKQRSALVPVTLSLLAILAGVVALAGADLVTGLALALLLISAALIVGAWRGRARGLIGLAVMVSFVMFVASLLDVPFTGGAGERRFVPASVAEVDSPYRMVAGELAIDLSHLDLAGRSLDVEASMATGNIIITVPADVAVDVDAHVGGGEINVFGRSWEGLDVDQHVERLGAEGAGRLDLDVRVGFGELEVRRAAA